MNTVDALFMVQNLFTGGNRDDSFKFLMIAALSDTVATNSLGASYYVPTGFT